MRQKFLLFGMLLLFAGCSIKKMAINSMADSLAGSSDVYASDEDPELIRQALPFALKTIESLLVQAPKHEGLLVSAASGFTQYAYGFVWLDAEEIQNTDPAKAKELRRRARSLFLRARDYGFRALELQQPHFRDLINQDTKRALQNMQRRNVPALYWTGAAWGAAVTQAKGEMDLVADLPFIEAIMQRALELDESYDLGSLHEFFLNYEASRAAGSLEKARQHFERAMELNEGRRVFPLVSLAETISVQTQNRKEFVELIDHALAFDVNSVPSQRLANLLAQKRARQLKVQIDDLFLEGDEEEQQ